MKHISILIPQGEMTFSSVIGTYELFTKLNGFLVSTGKQPVFEIQLVGNKRKSGLHDGLFSIQPDINFKQVNKTDLIIIPAIPFTPKGIEENKIFIPWIINQYKQGAEVASLCTGAFLLASTGLLDGKDCSTHWNAAEPFRKLFPNVNLVTDKLITDENGLYTNGGAFSFVNLLVHLIEKYCGRELAILCSKVAEIDIDRNCQSPFHIFIGQKNHADEPIKKAQYFIENNVTKRISVNDLAKDYAISKRSFERRFKKATANTPVEYIQRVKIEYAKKNLEIGRKNVNEVMYELGYSDRKSFRTTFRKITGLMPLEYRNKYNKEAYAIH
jgi:transcriptional regulator GlxA family with amidase domain